MAFLTPAQYKRIINNYADAQVQVQGVADYYYDAAYEVVILQAFDPEIDLLQPFYQAYLGANTAYSSPPSAVVNAVKTLQEHILRRAADKDTGVRFTSINDWFADEPTHFPTGVSALIPQQFADLSEQAGHTIESTYID